MVLGVKMALSGHLCDCLLFSPSLLGVIIIIIIITTSAFADFILVLKALSGLKTR